MQIFVQNPFSERTQIVSLSKDSQPCIQGIWAALTHNLSQHRVLNHELKTNSILNEFRFVIDGKSIQNNEQLVSLLKENVMIRVLMRLKGGKGGFGSQMKKEAMSQKKITNWDLSRNLQNRRVRDVNNEKKLIEFVKKQKKEQENVDKEMKEFKEMQKQQGNTNFGYEIMNNDYRDRTEQGEESISQSVLKGIKNQKKKKAATDQNEELNRCADGFLIPKKIKKEENNEQAGQSNAVQEEKSNESQETQIKEEKALEKPAELSNSSSPKDSTKSQESPEKQEQNEPKDATVVEVVPVAADKKENEVDAKKLIALGENNAFGEINLNSITCQEDLVKIGDAHLKHELTRLGLKASGRIEEKVARLWAIKLDPQNLFNPKYLAKKK